MEISAMIRRSISSAQLNQLGASPSMPRTRILESQISSGNVFANLGHAGAEEHLTKAGLVAKIDQIIGKRGLTQAVAVSTMGIDPRCSGGSFAAVRWSG